MRSKSDVNPTFLNEEGFNDIQFKFAGRLPYLWKGMLASARLS